MKTGGKRTAIVAGILAAAAIGGTAFVLLRPFSLRHDIAGVREKHRSLGMQFEDWLKEMIEGCALDRREADLSIRGDLLTFNGSISAQFRVRRIFAVLREGIPARPATPLESAIAAWNGEWRRAKTKELVRKAAEEIRERKYGEAKATCDTILELDPNHRVARFWLRDIAQKIQAGPRIMTASPSIFHFPTEADWEAVRKQGSAGDFTH